MATISDIGIFSLPHIGIGIEFKIIRLIANYNSGSVYTSLGVYGLQIQTLWKNGQMLKLCLVVIWILLNIIYHFKLLHRRKAELKSGTCKFNFM